MTHQFSRVTLIALVGVVALIAVGSHFMVPSSTSTTLTPTTAVSTASIYLLSAVGTCKGPTGYTPCFGGNVTEAELFNCANAATSSAGCTKVVVSPSDASVSYEITVWYPYLAHSSEPSWANCKYQSSGDAGQQYFAYCLSTNSTAFIVTEPSLPPV